MSLDVEEKHLLIYFGADASPWHHRLLLLQLGGPRWIVATPDLEAQVADFSNEAVRVLARNSPTPADCRPNYSPKHL